MRIEITQRVTICGQVFERGVYNSSDFGEIEQMFLQRMKQEKYDNIIIAKGEEKEKEQTKAEIIEKIKENGTDLSDRDLERTKKSELIEMLGETEG